MCGHFRKEVHGKEEKHHIIVILVLGDENHLHDDQEQEDEAHLVEGVVVNRPNGIDFG
jgi:hypothetical protein